MGPLSFLQWNAQGLPSHGCELQSYLASCHTSKPDIICVQETWFKENNVVQLENYTCIPHNRISGNRGGCATYIRGDLNYRLIDTPTDEEYQCVEISFENLVLNVINLYNPCKRITCNYLSDIWNRINRPIILCGDFNSHHEMWGSDYCDKNGKEIVSFLSENDAVVLNNGDPTRLDPHTGTLSCLDLTIVSRRLAVKSKWSVISDRFGSDHFPVEVTIEVSGNEYKKETSYDGKCYKKIDWSIYKQEIDDCFLMKMESYDVQSEYKLMLEVINNAVEKASVDCSNRNKKRHSSIPWWNKDCWDAVKVRNKVKRKFMRTGKYEDLCEYKQKKASAQRVIRQAKMNYWRNYCKNMNRFTPVAQIWRKIRRMRGEHSNNKKAIIMNVNGIYITDESEVANVLGSCYQENDRVYNENSSDENDASYLHSIHVSDSLNEPFNFGEFRLALKMSKESTPGRWHLQTPHCKYVKKCSAENTGIVQSYLGDL